MEQTTTRLGRDVFMALAAIGWADGEYKQDEADALVRAALEEGLEVEQIAEIEEATKKPVQLGAIDLSKLTKEDRLFIYAVAYWMCRVDGELRPSEQEQLNKLGDVLKIPEKPRHHAETIAYDIACQPAGSLPSDYDLPKVRKTIADRLAEARRLRTESGSKESGADGTSE